MAWISNTNNATTNGAEMLFVLKNTLVSASWTIISSSNGTTLSAGDIITSASVLTNASSYFLAMQPTGAYGNVQRILGVQSVGTNGGAGRMLYIHTSGSGDLGGTATTLPSGANEEFKWIAADRTNSITWYVSSNSRVHARAQNTAPYSFWLAGYPQGGGDPTCLFFCDALLSGTFPSNDNDPYVFHVGQGSSQIGVLDNNQFSMSQIASGSSFTFAPKCWYSKGLTGEAWRPVGLAAFGWVNVTTPTFQSSLGTNALNNLDLLLPGFWGTPSGNGFKGVSTLIRMNSSNRSTASTISTTSGSMDWIAFKNILLPWNGTSPTI